MFLQLKTNMYSALAWTSNNKSIVQPVEQGVPSTLGPRCSRLYGRKYSLKKPRKLFKVIRSQYYEHSPGCEKTHDQFNSNDTQNECGLSHLSNRLIRNFLHANKAHF